MLNSTTIEIFISRLQSAIHPLNYSLFLVLDLLQFPNRSQISFTSTYRKKYMQRIYSVLFRSKVRLEPVHFSQPFIPLKNVITPTPKMAISARYNLPFIWH